MNNFLNGDLRDLGNVLLTGASGFLGIHILKELIENEEGIIYCLQRAGKTITAEDRLKSLLFYYFDENYEDIFGKKIIVVEGDITNIEDFKKLENYPIDTIINAAANVKHFAEGSQIEDVNIFGVKNGLEFAKTVGACYVQVSTTSTAGESVNNFPPKDTVFDEQTLYVGQALDNKYLSSKFAAERLVLEHVVEGGDGKIVRVGNLMARESDAEFQINFESNGFINRIKAYVTLHAMPFELLVAQTEFSPIDVVANNNLHARPGMAIVTKMGNGQYALVFESHSGSSIRGIYLKVTNNLEVWDAADTGVRIRTNQNVGLASAPAMTWTPNGSPNGTLIITGQYNTDSSTGNANLSATRCDMFLSFDYGQTFVNAPNRILDDNDVTGLSGNATSDNPDIRSGYSAGLFTAQDGSVYYVNNHKPTKSANYGVFVFAKFTIS
jgi:nucleoside-diphosphate-sugar epimerase